MDFGIRRGTGYRGTIIITTLLGVSEGDTQLTKIIYVQPE